MATTGSRGSGTRSYPEITRAKALGARSLDPPAYIKIRPRPQRMARSVQGEDRTDRINFIFAEGMSIEMAWFYIE
jgi:hypothetical protein